MSPNQTADMTGLIDMLLGNGTNSYDAQCRVCREEMANA